MNVLLLRHGKTKGNEEHRYLGKTEESLSELGRKELLDKKEHSLCLMLERFKIGLPDIVFSSPMKRCIETAELLFPQAAIYTEDRLSECDFGIFEYKNYQELNGQKEYQAWIDQNGNMDIPGGESFSYFKQRSVAGFLDCIETAKEKKIETAVFIVHGGTIMSVMEALVYPKKGYYSWQNKNGTGYLCQLKSGCMEVVEIYDE